MQKKYFFDMDGTLAEWRGAASYEDLFKEGYFSTLNPYGNVLQAAKLLTRKTSEVYVLSVYLPESRYALNEKDEWVSQYLPEIDEAHRLFVPQGVSKASFVKEKVGEMSRDFILLDDYTVNLEQWHNDGGTAIKLRNGVNGNKGTWTGACITRYAQPEEITRFLLDVHKKGICENWWSTT